MTLALYRVPVAMIPCLTAVAHNHEGSSIPVPITDAVALAMLDDGLTTARDRGRAGLASPLALLAPRKRTFLRHSHTFPMEPAITLIASEHEHRSIFLPRLAAATSPQPLSPFGLTFSAASRLGVRDVRSTCRVNHQTSITSHVSHVTQSIILQEGSLP